MIFMQSIHIVIAILFPRFGRYFKVFVEKYQSEYNSQTLSYSIKNFVGFVPYWCSSLCLKCLIPFIHSLIQLNSNSPLKSLNLHQRICISFLCLLVFHLLCISSVSLFKCCLTLWLVLTYFWEVCSH